MKIAYFHQYFSTPCGSSGTRSYEMARRLVSRGHHVTMVCGSAARAQTGLCGPFNRGRRRGTVDGIDVIEFDLSYSNKDGLAARLFKFLKFALQGVGVALTADYDLIFATSTPLTAGIPGIFARWIRGKPFVFEVRDLWPELPKAMGVIRNPLLLWSMGVLEWLSYSSARRHIGLSPGIVEGIARRGVDRSKIAFIPNGCDLAIFATSESWRPHGVKDSDLMAVFAGAHGAANGLDAVLDVAAELRRQSQENIKIVLVGDGKLKPRLQLRARQETLTNVIFHDPVSKDRLAALMSSADIGLQILDNVPAFYYGTSPNKFFDYIAAGLPVLINYPGWLAELVCQYECGYSVPPENARAFAAALIHASENPGELASMRGRARSLAQSKFDRRMLADQFCDWLESSVGT